MRPLLKFWGLPRQRRRLLLRVVFWVLFARFGLRLLRFTKLRPLMEKWVLRQRAPQTPFSPQELAFEVGIVSGRIPGATCLVQALALHSLLRWCRYPSQLEVGVAKGEGGQFQAHAWVKHQGQILIGGESSNNYTPLLSLNQE